MDHRTIQDKLFLLGDGELPENERRILLSHLNDCGECATLILQWRKVQETLGPASLPEPSEVFVYSVLDRLEPHRAPEPIFNPQRLAGWLLPRLSLGLTAILVTLMLIRPQTVIATESLLLARSPEGSDWEFSRESPDVELLFSQPQEAP